MNVSTLISVKPATSPPAADIGSEFAKAAIHGKSLPAEVAVLSTPETRPEQNPKSSPDAEELRGLVAQANEAISMRSSNLKFTVAEGSDIPVVQVLDSETGAVIRQIPSEEMVAVAQALDNLMQGMFLEEKA